MTSNGSAAELPGLRACLEAILLVVDEPVAELLLAQVLEPAAGQPGPGVGGAGCQLRWGPAHAGPARPDRGAVHRSGDRCDPVPDHQLLPGTARPGQPGRAARAGAVPA